MPVQETNQGEAFATQTRCICGVSVKVIAGMGGSLSPQGIALEQEWLCS